MVFRKKGNDNLMTFNDNVFLNKHLKYNRKVQGLDYLIFYKNKVQY